MSDRLSDIDLSTLLSTRDDEVPLDDAPSLPMKAVPGGFQVDYSRSVPAHKNVADLIPAPSAGDSQAVRNAYTDEFLSNCGVSDDGEFIKTQPQKIFSDSTTADLRNAIRDGLQRAFLNETKNSNQRQLAKRSSTVGGEIPATKTVFSERGDERWVTWKIAGGGECYRLEKRVNGQWKEHSSGCRCA